MPQVHRHHVLLRARAPFALQTLPGRLFVSQLSQAIHKSKFFDNDRRHSDICISRLPVEVGAELQSVRMQLNHLATDQPPVFAVGLVEYRCHVDESDERQLIGAGRRGEIQRDRHH